MDVSTNHKQVRLAELEIDPPQLEIYLRHLQTEIEASLASEPGVLMLYALKVKNQPHLVRMVEVYANQSAYEAHLQTPHFLEYKKQTAAMVESLRLIETDPIFLGAQPAKKGSNA